VAIALLVFLVSISLVKAPEESFSIHPYDYGTTISYTDTPGKKIGCLTSGTLHTLWVDFYYYGNGDQDQRLTSLTMEVGNGINEDSYVPVAFSVTWEYSIDGEVTWHSYSGTGDIDVPYSGKNGGGLLQTSDPHATVKLTFPVSGSLGQTFYYRIHFTSQYYGGNKAGQQGNSGNHYFWYEICHVPGVPEFGIELPLITSAGFVIAYATRRRRLGKY
jgi:hypothetical protein